MFGLEYHGDTDNISQRQLEFVSEVLNKHGYTGKQVVVSTLGKAGDNYTSYVKRFTIDLEDGKSFNMIGKIAPSGYLTGSPNPTSSVFTNEILLDNEILPKIGQLQKSVDIPEEDRLRYPLCYGTLSELTNEIILLEDLGVKNYVMLDKKKSLSHHVIKMVLQNIANFHSLSYVVKDKDPQTFKKYLSTLGNILMNSETLLKAEMLFQVALNEIKSVFNDDQYVDVIDDAIRNFIHSSLKLSMADQGSKYSIIQHGDLWTNNVMFQKQGDEPVECILIDYQMVRESLPVADIHNLIFNCTDYETRSKHYYEWIDYYHSELDRYLNYFGLKVNYVYPRDKLDADLKRYGKTSLGRSMVVISFILRGSEEALDMTTMYEIMDDANVNHGKIVNGLGVKNLMTPTVEALKKRVKGLVDSCIELGYLSNLPKSSFK